MFLIIGKIAIICLLIIALFYIPFTQSLAISNPTPSPEETEFRRRQSEIRNSSWKCETPKPTLVYLIEEHRDRADPSIKWVPAAAIVNRCGKSTGYCTDHPTKTCQATGTEEVQVLFKKVKIIEGRDEFESLPFVSHTACGCKP